MKGAGPPKKRMNMKMILNDCVSELQVLVLIYVTCNVTCSPISRHVPDTYSGTHHSSHTNTIVKYILFC